MFHQNTFTEKNVSWISRISITSGIFILLYRCTAKILNITFSNSDQHAQLTCIYLSTVDREIFTLKIILTKNFHADKFSRFRSILEYFLCKMFYSRVKFSRLVSTTKLFQQRNFPNLRYMTKLTAFCVHHIWFHVWLRRDKKNINLTCQSFHVEAVQSDQQLPTWVKLTNHVTCITGKTGLQYKHFTCYIYWPHSQAKWIQPGNEATTLFWKGDTSHAVKCM